MRWGKSQAKNPRVGLGGGSGSATVTPTSAPVSNGTAMTTFTATEAGTHVVDVTDGETPLAQMTITVTAAPAVQTPSATPVTPTPSATPAASDSGSSSALVWTIAIIAVVVIGAAVAVILVVRKRRTGTDAADSHK